MNQIAHPARVRAARPAHALSGFGAALLETVAFLTGRSSYAVFAPPKAYRHAVSRRAQRFMRSGE